MRDMNIKEWWEECLSPEVRRDFLSYHKIDFDWIRCYLPIYYHDKLTKNHQMRIKSISPVPPGQHYFEFLVSIEDEFNHPLFCEKLRGLRNGFL